MCVLIPHRTNTPNVRRLLSLAILHCYLSVPFSLLVYFLRHFCHIQYEGIFHFLLFYFVSFSSHFPSINSSKFTIVFGNIQRIVSHFCRMFLRVHNMFHYYHHQCRVGISLFIQRLAMISVTFILPTWMLTTRHGIVCPFTRYDFLCLVDILVRFFFYAHFKHS